MNQRLVQTPSISPSLGGLFDRQGLGLFHPEFPFLPRKQHYCMPISAIRDIVKRLFIGALPRVCHPYRHGLASLYFVPVPAMLLLAQPLVGPIPDADSTTLIFLSRRHR